MRLIQKDLKDVQVFTNTEQPSAYVGTERVWVKARIIKANVQTIQSKRLVEIYGERVLKMLQLTTQELLVEGEGIHLSLAATAPVYRVESVLPYSQHNVVVVEVI